MYIITSANEEILSSSSGSSEIDGKTLLFSDVDVTTGELSSWSPCSISSNVRGISHYYCIFSQGTYHLMLVDFSRDDVLELAGWFCCCWTFRKQSYFWNDRADAIHPSLLGFNKCYKIYFESTYHHRLDLCFHPSSLSDLI